MAKKMKKEMQADAASVRKEIVLASGGAFGNGTRKKGCLIGTVLVVPGGFDVDSIKPEIDITERELATLKRNPTRLEVR